MAEIDQEWPRMLYDPANLQSQAEQIPFRPHSATLVGKSSTVDNRSGHDWTVRSRPNSAPGPTGFPPRNFEIPKDDLRSRPPSRHLKRLAEISDTETIHRRPHSIFLNTEEWNVDDLTMGVIGMTQQSQYGRICL